MKTFETTTNDIIAFASIKAAAFKENRKFEIEVGNCAVSEFAWFSTLEQALAGKALLAAEWSDEEAVGEIESDAIRLLGTDDDGDHDEDLDEDLY